MQEETSGEPHAVVLANARRKAVAVSGDLVLGADTIVAVDGDILGKPGGGTRSSAGSRWPPAAWSSRPTWS